MNKRSGIINTPAVIIIVLCLVILYLILLLAAADIRNEEQNEICKLQVDYYKNMTYKFCNDHAPAELKPCDRWMLNVSEDIDGK